MNYFTGVGGYNDNAEGNASFYQGPAGVMLGEAGAFTASVMFSAHALTPAGAAGVLFSGRATGPDTGWEIRLNGPPAALGQLDIAAETRVTAGAINLVAQVNVEEGAPSRPYYILTLVSDPTLAPDGGMRFYMNAVAYMEQLWAEGDAYLPPPAGTQPSIGARPNAALAAETALILGAAYHPAVIQHEQILRHQLACLEAGAMVDGSVGGAFSAGVPSFAHIYDARRNNAGVGETTFVAGVMNNSPVGQVPRAVASWLDLGTGPVANLTRVDAGPDGVCFTTAIKRVG